MVIRNNYIISPEFKKEALDYALASRSFTSNRHDFHPGGLNNKQKKMYEGKLGEKCFKMFLIDNCIRFEEDKSPCTEADLYDFILPNKIKIDVKTRTESFHIRTLEMVESVNKAPKDIYVSCRLYKDTESVSLLGWYTREDMLNANHIENNGYLDNYVMYDSELRPMSDLFDLYLKQFKINI